MSASFAAIVVCRSNDDGDATAYGPFEGDSYDSAVRAARAWLRRQRCRPRKTDPIWTTSLWCENVESQEPGTTGHEIVRLIR